MRNGFLEGRSSSNAKPGARLSDSPFSLLSPSPSQARRPLMLSPLLHQQLQGAPPGDRTDPLAFLTWPLLEPPNWFLPTPGRRIPFSTKRLRWKLDQVTPKNGNSTLAPHPP